MRIAPNRATICFLVSSPMTLKTLEPHIRALAKSQRVVVVANFDFGAPFFTDAGYVSVVHLPMIRRLAPVSDFETLVGLLSLFSKIKPEVLVTVTPKAGLLGQIAGMLARIPTRIHWFTGQVWSNKRGLLRGSLKLADRLIASLCTFGWVDGHAQLSFLESQRVVSRRKFSVLLHGSVAGVDTDCFRPNATVRAEVRGELEIGLDEVVISYLGRLTRDKGVVDLANALVRSRKLSNICLVAMGPDEEGIQEEFERALKRGDINCRFLGHVTDPEKYLQASDIFCLPSYREGFPTSVLQASAVGLPVVVSRIYGTEGTFLEGITGISFSPGNLEELAGVIWSLIDSREKSKEMGLAAREYVLSNFKQIDLVNAFVEEIRHHVEEGPTVPAKEA
jgi:glycosyltransferase involved in cell wall biosynthesis